MTPRQRDVWLAELDPAVGHEQAGRRPVVVVSVDQLNEAQPPDLAIVVPLTSTDRGQRLHVPIEPPEGGLDRRSFALVEMVRSVSHRRLIERRGAVRSVTLQEIVRRVHVLTRAPSV